MSIPIDPLEGMAHGDGVGLEIDVGPGQPEQLALAQPGADGGDEERFESVAGDGREEAPDLVRLERMDRSAWHPWRVGELDHVA